MVHGACAVGLACGAAEVSERAGPAGQGAPRGAPEVLQVGCETRADGCALAGDGSLRLHVGASPEAPLGVTLDGAPLPASWTRTAEGRRAELRPGPGLLQLAGDGWSWSLRLLPAATEVGPLAELRALSQRGGDAEALARLAALLPGLQGAERAEALKLRGDLEFLRGAYAEALAAYDVAFSSALAAGLLGRASDVALTATFVCAGVERDLPAARTWLARHASLIDRVPEARLRHGHYAGLVADRTGDASAAIRDYREHARVAGALGQALDQAAALSAIGVLLGRLGDASAAEAAFAEALALGDAVPPAVRAAVLHNAAWVALEARARGEAAPDPEARLAEAAEIFAASPHEHRLQADEARLNLAYAAVLRGDAAAAGRALAKVEAGRGRAARWRSFLAAQIDRLEGRTAQALAGFRAVGEAELQDEDRGLAWSAALGAGEALLGLGDREGALAEFRRAAALHRADVGALALEFGRSRFAATRDLGAQKLVALLLQLGRREEALCAARRARAQAFADVAAATRDPAALAAYREARAELDEAIEGTWDMSFGEGEQERARLRSRRRALDRELDAALRGRTGGTGLEGHEVGAGGEARGAGAAGGGAARGEGRGAGDAGGGAAGVASGGASGVSRGTGLEGQEMGCEGVREPEPGELLLVYFPLERGFAGFARGAGGVAAAVLGDETGGEPEARAQALLGPFAAEIAAARRVTVAASGRLAAEAFHALPWGEGPLVAGRAVAYSLDLTYAPGRPSTPARALQLVPPSNLARAEEEAARSAALLRARGVEVRRARGDEPGLRASLGEVDLLHFVGHARGDGWSAALDLGGARSLGVGDLLAGPAPALALLSGCETGLLDPRAHAGGVSLAHALLLAGSSGVIAAEREVADDLAAELVPAVLDRLAGGEGPAEALRAAQLQVMSRREDWWLFRAFVP